MNKLKIENANTLVNMIFVLINLDLKTEGTVPQIKDFLNNREKHE